MNKTTERARSAYRAGITLLVVAALYEAVARSGLFPAALADMFEDIGGLTDALSRLFDRLPTTFRYAAPAELRVSARRASALLRSRWAA